MPGDHSSVVDVVTKSIEFRQTVVTLLLGVVGFILGKTWRDSTGKLDAAVFWRLSPCIASAAVSLGLMLYEQRLLVQAVSRDAVTDFATHWLNIGELRLDFFIVVTALCLLFGAIP